MSLQSFFYQNGLPFDDTIATRLNEFGVKCVEELKITPDDIFVGFFACIKMHSQMDN